MGKVRHKGVNSLAEGHINSKRGSQDPKPDIMVRPQVLEFCRFLRSVQK